MTEQASGERQFHVLRDGIQIASFYLTGALDEADQYIVDEIGRRYCTECGIASWVVADSSHLVMFPPRPDDGLFQVVQHGHNWLSIQEFCRLTNTEVPKETLQ